MKQIKSIIVLVSICVAVSVALAVTNQITAPMIEANENAAANNALLQVLPEGKEFQPIDLSTWTLPTTVTGAYSEAGGGYVIRLTTTGYGPDMNLMVGVNAEGRVRGALCLSSNETLGYEKTYGQALIGMDAERVGEADTVAGATLTTTAYRGAVKDALNAAIILGGGSADLRDEEEILNDSLAQALPEGEGHFEELFIVEDIADRDRIDAIYRAENGKGYVVLADDRFIGVGEDGRAPNETEAELKAVIENAILLLSATEVTEVELTPYEMPTQLVSAQKTATGNYVIEMKAAGYGIVGGDRYHPASGEYILIRVSVTAYGKILDCITVSQQESAGIGDACAKESFYGQFDGKTEADYREIDAIAGATMTTNGYVDAIGRVFDVVNILEGGAENEE